MFCSGYDIVLDGVSQVYKVRAESGDPDHEITVIFRMPFGINKSLLIDHIELNMVSAPIEISFYQSCQFLPVFIASQKMGGKFHIEEVVNGRALV